MKKVMLMKKQQRIYLEKGWYNNKGIKSIVRPDILLIRLVLYHSVSNCSINFFLNNISQGLVSLSVIRTLVSVTLSLAQVVHSPIFIFLQSSLIQRERQTDSWSVSQSVS